MVFQPRSHYEMNFAKSFEELLRDFGHEVLRLHQQCQEEQSSYVVDAGARGIILPSTPKPSYQGVHVENRNTGAAPASPNSPSHVQPIPKMSDDIDLEKNNLKPPESNAIVPSERATTSRAEKADKKQRTGKLMDGSTWAAKESDETPDGPNRYPSTGHGTLLNLHDIPSLVDKLHGRETIFNEWQKFIFSDVYVGIVTAAIILQGAVLGVEVQLEMDIEKDRLNGRPTWEVPFPLLVINYSLLVFFLLEVALRVAILRLRFFFPSDSDAQAWNLFDLFIVFACIPDFFPSVFGELPIVHAFRLLRVIRVLRVARGIPSLRKMVFALLHCMSSLLWLVALMFLLLYMFGLAFMQGAASHMRDMDPERRLAKRSSSDCIDVGTYDQFSNIAISMQTLFLSVTGDADWDKTMKSVMDSNWFYKCLGLFFSVFFFFGFMNVATGLFVDKAMQIASHDREMLMKEVSEKEKEEMAAMRDLFLAADVDGDGDLTIHELYELVSHPDVRSWLATIDLDIVDDFDAVTRIIDHDGKGYITADEFYKNIGHFKGPARRLETTLLLMEARHAHRSFHDFHKKHDLSLDKAISHLEKHGLGSPSKDAEVSFLHKLGFHSGEHDKQEAEKHVTQRRLSERLTELEDKPEDNHKNLLTTLESRCSELQPSATVKESIVDVGYARPDIQPRKEVDHEVDEASLQHMVNFVDGDLDKHVKKLSATQARVRKKNRELQDNERSRHGTNLECRSQERWERENKLIPSESQMRLDSPLEEPKLHHNSLLAAPTFTRARLQFAAEKARGDRDLAGLRWNI